MARAFELSLSDTNAGPGRFAMISPGSAWVLTRRLKGAE
jgi:hypothetical protein